MSGGPARSYAMIAAVS